MLTKVLCHQVPIASHIFYTSHAAVLFPRGKEYTYIETAGGSGPFVRLDFADKSDLWPWLVAMYAVPMQTSARVFVTLNDTKLEKLSFRRANSK